MSGQPDIRVFEDPQSLFEGAAEEFASQATAAVRSRGRFTVALSGGSTPRSLYSLLATRASLPWDKIYFFFGDERHVPPDNPESNYRMARESLLSKIPIPPENVFRVPAENPDANQAAEAYEQTLRTFFNTAPGSFPRFDMILLGMGPDGHTASLFPGTAALQEKARWVVSQLGGKVQDGSPHANTARAEQRGGRHVSGKRAGQSRHSEGGARGHATRRTSSFKTDQAFKR